MRERTRTVGKSTIPRDEFYYVIDGVKQPTQYGAATTVAAHTEVMVDETLRSGIGFCDHVITDLISYSPGSGPQINEHDNQSIQHVSINMSPPLDPFPSPDGRLGDQFIIRAIQSIKPKLKANISVPNFLLELKDLKRIIPSSSTLQRLAASLTAIATNPFKGSRKWAVAELHNEVAAQHLSAQFGYLPLIDDAFNLASSIEAFGYKVKDFKKNAGKPQTGYYKETWGRTFFPKVVTAAPFGGVVRYCYQDEILEGHSIVGLKYSYDVDIPSIKSPYLFTKFLGFRNNPRILWDAIPFSFIIDWFLGVGRFLESLDDGAVPVDMKITAGWLTEKYVIERQFFMEFDSFGNWDCSGESSPRGKIRFERYVRRPLNLNWEVLAGIPPLPTFNSLTRNKVALASSLGKVLSHKR